MGENDEFYTTDTEAYLVFELDDENFNPATAVLTLENRNDGSLKNETVDVVDGLIEWELPQRYIEHFGNWQGQLVYEDTKDGQPESYTSATFTFVVNAHIGDKKKPSLVEIENWEKFIRDGTELIETWEDLEALREENERQRQENEQGRESAESERVANETERISKDSERDSKIEAIEGNLESKANKKQEDWITPTLINGWEQHPAYDEVGYYKDDFGVVHLRGSVGQGEFRTNVFILPSGYRPSKFTFYPVVINHDSTSVGSLYVSANGAVFSYHTGEALSLNHISFRAER